MSVEDSEAPERWQAWLQWKERCDWWKCDAVERGLLATLVLNRFRSLLNWRRHREAKSGWSTERFNDFFRTEEGAHEKNMEIAFTIFEHDLRGKHFKKIPAKDWLFEGGTRKCVEGRLTSRLRSGVFRQWFGDERKMDRVGEVFDPQGKLDTKSEIGEGASPGLIALTTVGEATPLELDRYCAQADKAAQAIFDRSSTVARVAWSAKRTRISTDNELVNKAAGAKRTKISAEWKKLHGLILEAIEEEGFEPDDQDEMLLYLQLLTSGIDEKVKEWAKGAENMDWADFKEVDDYA